MAAARLLVAVQQGLLVGLEEDHLGSRPAALELVEHRQQILEVVAAANVGDDRRPLAPRCPRAGRARRARRSSAAAGCRRRSSRRPRRRRSPPTCRRPSTGDHDQVDPVLAGPAPSPPAVSSRHQPALWSCSWISRASLPGSPGTASSSSRLAPRRRSGRAEVAQQGPLARRADARQLVEHRRRHRLVAAARWCSIAKRCASSRIRCSSCSASESRGSRIGSERPGHEDLLEPLGEADDRHAALGERLERPHPGRELALAAVDHDQRRQRGEARVAVGVVRREVALLEYRASRRTAPPPSPRSRRGRPSSRLAADLEAAVVGLLRRAALEHDHRGDRVGRRRGSRCRSPRSGPGALQAERLLQRR